MIEAILNHPLLTHWYAENLDEATHPKISPLPLGLVFADGHPDEGIPVPQVPAIANRPLKVFCVHRHREGAQWEPRRHVSKLAAGPWADFATEPESELPEPEFFARVEDHSFVLCVEGGGLDPSPKAWSALLHGAIPIMRKTPVSGAYMHLPVVLVEDWRADVLRADLLAHWRDRLQPWFDDAQRRNEVIHRLSLEYWWRLVATGEPLLTGQAGLDGTC